MKSERINILRQGEQKKGPVVYWMSRDQRLSDNWALIYAQENALENNSPLIVLFCLVPEFLDSTLRQYSFMIDGLKSLSSNLEAKNIEFCLLFGEPGEVIPEFIEKNKVSALITDFDPLKIKKKWKKDVFTGTKIPFYEVDTHNIIPCWLASNKQEYAARTLRPKIHKLLEEFLEEFPQIKPHPYHRNSKKEIIGWKNIIEKLNVDKSVKPIDWTKAGEENAKFMLNDFIENRLEKYAKLRNDPTVNYQSNLSPYLHFGQIASQRVVLEVSKSDKDPESVSAFLEEIIVRKELSDNFCHHNPDYDNFNAFPDWAKTTLNEHRDDIRPNIFSLEELEQGKTYDELWNACQMEMVKKGKMHGYMRMYWAKKILEWTSSPEKAQKIAIYLNDKYEIDGRAPNGYTGIAWSIGGIHDRAWPSRYVFGKIRYMSYKGLKSKFNVEKYIKMIKSL